MAISAGYVTRETLINLRRNLLMTVAAILTVGVSLSLAGGALLSKQGVNKATIQWRGGVELSVYMKADASPEQINAMDRTLRSMPEIRKLTYLNHDAAYEEAKVILADQPDLLDTLTVETTPPSFRVVPRRAELTSLIGDRVKGSPGVYEVKYAKETIDKLLEVTSSRQLVFTFLAGVCLLAAALLIFITIQLAIFARRREVAVMKLVGATNWFIRIPFMLEGMLQGVVGGLVAFGVVFALRDWVMKLAVDPSVFSEAIYATSRDAVGTGLLLLTVGAVVGAASSALAVRRFLEV